MLGEFVREAILPLRQVAVSNWVDSLNITDMMSRFMLLESIPSTPSSQNYIVLY